MTVLLQITSGRGPVECCWVVARLAEAMIVENDPRVPTANGRWNALPSCWPGMS